MNSEGGGIAQLPMEELPDNMGRHFATCVTAQVGASAAAGALAVSHINALLAPADADAALAATQGAITHLTSGPAPHLSHSATGPAPALILHAFFERNP